MKLRSRAPMRLSFGGGGSEISPYVDEFGGITLSTTVSVFARATLTTNDSKEIIIHSQDTNACESIPVEKLADFDLRLSSPATKLASACIKYVSEVEGLQFQKGFNLSISSDAPQGSGLGASSVLTVAILKLLDELFDLHWTKHNLAKKAFDVERNMLKLSGGKQDHYAAAFGGINYIQYDKSGVVSVEELDLDPFILKELESSILCLYTGRSRESANIIQDQQSLMNNRDIDTIKHFHRIVELATEMRVRLKKGDMKGLGQLLSESWNEKKATSSLVSNDKIDQLMSSFLDLGVYGGKIAGAGGGGFLMLLVPPEKRKVVINAFSKEDAVQIPVVITKEGAHAWRG